MRIESINKHIIIAGCIGSILEWYNFLLYAYLAVTISKLFFPAVGKQNALLLTFLLWAVGFIARPLGGLFLGWLGDIYGRQKTLLISQICMSAPTLLICFLPTYQQIGLLAPLIFACLRFLQGVSISGEQPAALTYLAEMAPINRRGLWVSSVPAATAGGILLSAIVVYFVMKLLNSEQFTLYGWRLCFFTGFILTIIGIGYRWFLPESTVFLKINRLNKNRPRKPVLTKQYLLRAIVMMGLVMTQAYFYQLLYVWTPTFLSTYRHINLTKALLFNIIIMVIFCSAIVIGGYFIDKYGRKPILLFTTSLLMIISGFFYSGIAHYSLSIVLCCLAAMSLIFGLFMGTISTVFTEIFPARIRVLSVSIIFNVVLAIVGGFSPSLFEFSLRFMGTVGITISAILVAFISLLVSFFVHDMKGKSIVNV